MSTNSPKQPPRPPTRIDEGMGIRGGVSRPTEGTNRPSPPPPPPPKKQQ